MNKLISIFGSTGSIGTQTLDIISQSNKQFIIKFLTTNSNIELLNKQVNEFTPYGVVINDYNSYLEFKKNSSYQGKVLYGQEGLLEAASEGVDIFVSALVGFAGVAPTLEAIKNTPVIALANKETLVSAGSIITEAAKKYNSKLIAIDSEHNAILQCLAGEDYNSIEKLILTASGGPFRTLALDKFKDITLEDALKHPNWSMGSKITIDSASMMNKGFEIIEAKWLFDIDIDKIDVIIHPQSIIHSLVQFCDASIKAQMGLPDMRIPISYALNYPKRLNYNFPRLDLVKVSKLDFWEPDFHRYPCLELAYFAIRKGGNLTCALNAANEVCVQNFLQKKIDFIQIPILIRELLEKIYYIESPNINEINETDIFSRELVNKLIKE
ncbi:MAG TPA: 1-deoxy-D-xylulose-5-phosphate reductoisomerase [Candidatus Kapabacteria bacterium]|nr:1-deoxy-D-xylulose-5-phosphate reductoisomerase [Candidatus Kapabacteria bacterium]